MKSVLSVQKISKEFISGAERVKAVDSVSFSIEKGEVFGLLGPNGAGKTTLISILCGFLIPTDGKAEMFGMDCTYESEKIHKRMNFTSGFGGVSEFFTAEELLHFYCMAYNLDNRKERIENALKETNITKYRNRRVSDFSSGLSRRFLISKSILNNPEVLLLDEPTVGLDVDSAKATRNLIRKMKKEGKTILLTTHNMKEAEELCDRVALIKEGKIIALGKFSELRRKFFPFEVLEIYCGNPSEIEKLVSKNKNVSKTEKSKDSLKIFLKNKKGIDEVLRLASKSKTEIRKVNTIEPQLEHLYAKVMRNE